MGPGEAALLGLVLLLPCGDLGVASFNASGLARTPSARPPWTMDRWGEPARSPVTYRLRRYQLRKKNPAGPLVEQETAPEVVTLLFQGPDLHPQAKQESKVKAEQRVPVAAESVAVHCRETEVIVEVNKNFLGNGQQIRASDLTLGGCPGVDAADHVLRFHTELPGCSSTLKMTEGALVYSFSLIYSPTPISDTVILKTNPAEVGIECHYRRRHYVSSSGATRPVWMPFAADALAEQQHNFSLRLMTEDWQSPRPSGVFLTSDVMHIEASVLQGHHAPLRVFVDSCVATTGPDPLSRPSYHFIRNHGCLTDAKLTGAKSYFMQRSREDKLHFLLKAFRFQGNHSGTLYVTCWMKVTSLAAPIDSQHKACSFLTEANRWVASGGDNAVCGCCESSCGEQRRRRSLLVDAGLGGGGVASLGPVILLEGDALEEASQRPLGPLRLQEAAQTASPASVALLCGVGVALAAGLLVFTGAVTASRLHALNGYRVST